MTVVRFYQGTCLTVFASGYNPQTELTQMSAGRVNTRVRSIERENQPDIAPGVYPSPTPPPTPPTSPPRYYSDPDSSEYTSTQSSATTAYQSSSSTSPRAPHTPPSSAPAVTPAVVVKSQRPSATHNPVLVIPKRLIFCPTFSRVSFTPDSGRNVVFVSILAREPLSPGDSCG